MEYDAEVEQAIEKDVPLFFRKMARKGLENYAAEKGAERVTMAIYLEAKAKYLGAQKPPTA